MDKFSLSKPLVRTCKDKALQLRIEPVGRGHLTALRELFERNATPAVMGTFDPFPMTAAQAQQIAVKRRRDLYYVAVHEGRMVALSMLRGFDEGYEIPSFGIFVDWEFQRRGFGRALTEWTLQTARDQGCNAVRLSVYGSNPVAYSLYTSLGFEEEERQAIEREGEPDEKIVMFLRWEIKLR